MFGCKFRTSLDLLRPSTVPAVVSSEETKNTRKAFKIGDWVYAKLYSGNQRSLAPGVVLEPIGRVMFNVWVEDKRIIRSHLKQLRTRTTSSKSSTNSVKSSPKLRLDILVKAWNLSKQRPKSSAIATPPLLPPTTPVARVEPSPPGIDEPSQRSTPLPPAAVPVAPARV
nr:uncharacterized protein LOC115266158 [Aedes albopictus]